MARRFEGMAKRASCDMTIVDTTVWIDFFRGTSTPEVEIFQHMLNAGEDICICGVILTEVLQGIREDAEHAEVLSHFEDLIFLPMNHRTFVDAAQLYRSLRRKGVTIRNSVDCMIAAVAIEHDIRLLHHARDYSAIAEHSGHKVIKTEEKRNNASTLRRVPRRK